VPNRVTRELKAFAREILEDPTVEAKLLEQARRGRLAPPVLVLLFHLDRPRRPCHNDH
jgi:hypothetical protein